jgi:hypothetical protein
VKNIEYLSPTSISLFYDNPQEFYLNYMSDNRPPRFPQTKAMAAGSSFDAHVKSFLHERLFGKGHDPKFGLIALFEAQVETHVRDGAYDVGQHCFDQYRESGALADLLLELGNAIGTPRFEFDVRGVVNGYREGAEKKFGDMVLLGKPDLFFMNKSGAHCILDWKVNGYYSDHPPSPMQGYVRLREGKVNKGQHKNAQLMIVDGMMINIGQCLEDVNADWARQLSIYAWLCGEEVGSPFIVGIDQLVCKTQILGKPVIRIAEHRTRVRKESQRKIFEAAQHVWDVSHSDHFFRDMTKEQSQERCAVLDKTALAIIGDGSDNDKWFASIARG